MFTAEMFEDEATSSIYWQSQEQFGNIPLVSSMQRLPLQHQKVKSLPYWIFYPAPCAGTHQNFSSKSDFFNQA